MEQKERPMLMTPENAQKSHDGTKTKTRRILKPQPAADVEWYGFMKASEKDTGWYPCKGDPKDIDAWEQAEGPKLVCPYGWVGDRLWIREAWQVDAPHDGTWPDTVFYGCKGAPLDLIPEVYRSSKHCLFRGSWTGTDLIWRPSIHMPRWACRTVVGIVSIEIERLQEITEEDARAEGIQEYGIGAIHDFMQLWTSINGEYSWALNPFVWVIEYKKVANG